MKRSRSSSRPKRSSSQRIECDQRLHRVTGLVEIAAARPRPAAAAPCPSRSCTRSSRADQLAGDQREQIARLLERVFPPREMAAVGRSPSSTRLPFDSSTGYVGLVGAQRDRVGRHHVRAVEEVGDAAKALGLALREEVAARHVEARQRGVRGRIADAGERQLEAVRHVVEQQAVLMRMRVGERLTVDFSTDELQLFAHQFQMRGTRRVGVAAHSHRIPDDRAFGDQIELQRDGIDQEGGRRVIGAADHIGRCGIGHGVLW